MLCLEIEEFLPRGFRKTLMTAPSLTAFARRATFLTLELVILKREAYHATDWKTATLGY